MRGTIAALIVVGAVACANSGDAAAAGFKPIFKVDSTAVTIQGDRMTIIATGAVATGGWVKARLRPHHGHKSEANTLEFDFIAVPPPADETVIQALVPQTASLKTRLPPDGITQIRVDAQTNSTTAPIER